MCFFILIKWEILKFLKLIILMNKTFVFYGLCSLSNERRKKKLKKSVRSADFNIVIIALLLFLSFLLLSVWNIAIVLCVVECVWCWVEENNTEQFSRNWRVHLLISSTWPLFLPNDDLSLCNCIIFFSFFHS